MRLPNTGVCFKSFIQQLYKWQHCTYSTIHAHTFYTACQDKRNLNIDTCIDTSTNDFNRYTL